jgi:hypothetical protein
MTWGSQLASLNNAPFATITSAGIIQSTLDQVRSPSDYSTAFWDNGHWWVDLASAAIVGTDGTLQVAAVHPGPSFLELTLDAIRVERIVESVVGTPDVGWIESINKYTSTVVRGNLDNGYRLDFGTQSSPVSSVQNGSPNLRDYLRVDETTNYTYRRGYGWIGQSPNALDQGGSLSDLSHLLRDGVWDTQERMLRLDLPAGQYRFTLAVGNAWSWDPILERPVFTGASGPKTTKQIELKHSQGGPLLLSLKPEQGADFWMLSSLDVQAVDSITRGSFSQTAGTSPTSRIARASNVPGGMYTIDLDSAKITLADADPTMKGHQVFVNSSGLLEVPFTANSTTGTVEIKAIHDQGIAEYTSVFFNAAPAVNLRLDLNGKSQQTQTGYIALPEKTWYTPSLGFGWQNPLETTFSTVAGRMAPPKESQWLDRTPPSGFDQTNVIGTSLTSLLRDGQKQSTAKEFRTDLPDGVYSVTITVGGPTAISDIDIGVADSPLQGISNIATSAGEYKRISFNATASNGRLILTFASSVARTEWAVNAIEIRNLVTPIPVTLTGGNVFEADRSTAYTVSTTVAPGTYTLLSTIGRLVSGDNDQRLSGLQLTVDSNGQASFQFSSEVSGDGEVLLRSLDGSVEYRIPVSFRYPQLRRFDFNHTQNPANSDGYRSVLPTNIYDPSKAFGWSVRPGSVDRTSAATPVIPQRLFQDKHISSSPLFFMVTADPGKTYDLRLHLGDSVARDVEISVNGQVFQRFTTAAGEYISPVIRTQNTDQRIEVYLRGVGAREWAINGMEVLEVTGSQVVLPILGASGLIAGIPSNIQRNQSTNGQILQPGTYWLSSDIGVLTNQSGQRLNQITIGSNGTADFTIRSSLPGSGTVRMDSVDGSVRYEIPVSFLLNPVRLYDFDHVNRGTFSPLASGYTRVLATDVYSQSTGFGWNRAVKSVDRGATARNLPTPRELNRDKHFDETPGSFFAMSEPGKSYSVTVHLGDSEARDVEISLDGGTTFERVTTAANSYTNRTWNVVATSDRIQVMFRRFSGTNWSANAIEIREQVSTTSLQSRSSRIMVSPTESLVGVYQGQFPPMAMGDLGATKINQPLHLNVLINDLSHFGKLNSNSIEIVNPPANGKVSLLDDGTLEFTPSLDYVGQVSFAYRVRDELGITSNYGEVVVNVTDKLHHNFINPLDVNADTSINPLDVLALIDRLNSSGATSLINQSFSQNLWMDVNANQYLDPLDVLQVIDYLNRSGDGRSSSPEGEGPSVIGQWSAPLAEPQWVAAAKSQNNLLDVRSEELPTKTSLSGAGYPQNPGEPSILDQLENYLTADSQSLTDEEIADRLAAFIDFGLDTEDEDTWL